MRNYGAMKATEFSRKQIGVLYRAMKVGELKISKDLIGRLYDLSEYYGYDDNKSIEWTERFVLSALENYFAGNIEEAQSDLDVLMN